MLDGTVDGFEPYEDAVSAMPAEPLPRLPKGEVMLYSSGTTGRPKGIKRALTGVEVQDASLSGIGMLEHHLLGMDENVHAVVQLEEGIEGTDDLVEELRSYARERLAGSRRNCSES